ncbi:MAG: ferric reductase [Frankiales bacterium]|nr:ferric reductase [Frankiales bacterium]
MSTASAPTLSEAPYWYLTRSTGIVAFVLLTVALAVGIAATQRTLASPSWPRFATQGLHRNVSLLGVAFLGVHIVTTLLDGFVNITWWAAVVPGASHYRTLWVALGTVAFDLTVLVLITSLLRLRLSAALWRRVHWSAYALWPLSWLHFLKTGTDAAHGRFGVWLAIACAGVVSAAVAGRVVAGSAEPQPLRSPGR